MIEIRNLCCSFGTKKVIDNVSLSIHSGKITAIIGRSGCGKSVLLKHIAGLIIPDSGEIYFQNEKINPTDFRQMKSILIKFGVLFQSGALFDSLSVEENISLPLKEHTDYSAERIREIVNNRLELVGLSGINALMPAELSGGMQKRVSLARALALSPSVILYDEPTTGLDPVTTATINNLISRVHQKTSVTSVIVTHDMNSAYALADEIAMLDQGKIIFKGTTAQIRSYPDEQVQNFIRGKSDENSNHIL